MGKVLYRVERTKELESFIAKNVITGVFSAKYVNRKKRFRALMSNPKVGLDII